MSKKVKQETKCIICSHHVQKFTIEKLKTTYYHCENCKAIFQDADQYLTENLEKLEYNNHNNSFESTGYVKMFEQLITDYIQPLQVKGKVLEFGSGPGPVLMELLKRQGYEVVQYDPFYHPSKAYQNHQYELITSTEVFEHFHDPIKEIRHLTELLKSKGYLVVMTNFHYDDIEAFKTWWYQRDKTHVMFYHLDTFKYIANMFQMEIVKTNDKNIIVMQKI